MQEVEGLPESPCAEPQTASPETSLSDGCERPILFSAPMVRGLLGDLKTQTRRMMKPQPPSCEAVLKLSGSGYDWLAPAPLSRAYGRPFWRPAGPVWAVRKLMEREPEFRCPYGVPGDRLWVREAWAVKRHEPCLDHERDWQELLGPTIRYLADGQERQTNGDRSTGVGVYRGLVEKGRPSIHMPRWASRITLEVTDVRVERLQDISEEDALAEGIQHYPDGFHWETNKGWPGEPEGMKSARFVGLTAHQAYMGLWEQINGRESLDANPWVWAVSFRRIVGAPLSVAARTEDPAPGGTI